MPKCDNGGWATSTSAAWSWKSGNGVAFDGSFADCDVCAVGKSHQLAHPKTANHAAINAPFQLVYGDLMGPLKPTAHGGYKFVSKITDHFTKWTAVYVPCSKYQALAPAFCHFNRDTSRQTHHQMACRHGKQTHGRRVQGLLPRIRYNLGIRCHQHTAAN